MRIVDYDMLGTPIYDPLDEMARAALLPVFYTDKRTTPYFIPRTAPPTKEGVDKLRREFYAAVRKAQSAK